MSKRILLIFISVVLFSGAVSADGIDYRRSYCHSIESAGQILSLATVDDMRYEVERRYEHALDVSLSRSANYSTTPVFTWAIEAKISCAKALGYLKRWKVWRPIVKDEMIQRCECFYDRMAAYSN